MAPFWTRAALVVGTVGLALWSSLSGGYAYGATVQNKSRATPAPGLSIRREMDRPGSAFLSIKPGPMPC
jgi:hypothetical protein